MQSGALSRHQSIDWQDFPLERFEHVIFQPPAQARALLGIIITLVGSIDYSNVATPTRWFPVSISS